jgi:hypothetical protein
VPTQFDRHINYLQTAFHRFAAQPTHRNYRYLQAAMFMMGRYYLNGDLE